MPYHQPTDEIQGKIYDAKLIKQLFHYVRPHLALFSFSLILLFLVSGLELVGPYLVKVGIDTYLKKADYSGLHTISTLFLLVLLVKFGLFFLQNYTTHLMGQRAIRDLRLGLFSHVQSLSFSFFDHYPVGRIMTRIGNDIEVLNEMISFGMIGMAGNILTLWSIVWIMLWLNWRLALVSFSILPLVIWGTLIFKNKVRITFRQIREKIARLNSFMQEVVTGIKEVQLFGREEENRRLFDQINAEHRDAYLKAIFYYALFMPFMEIVGSVATALIIWYGGLRAYGGALTIGVLVAFLEYMNKFFRPIRELSEQYNLLQAALAACERIFELLNTPQAIAFLPSSPKPFPGLQKDIIFDQVWFAYDGENYVVQDASFHLAKGKTLAIVGATGAGKTTLMHLLGRQYEPQRGRILIDGVDIREYDLKDLRSAMAIVQQDVFLFSHSIFYNITLGNPSIDLKTVQQMAEYINADTFIEKLPGKYDFVLAEGGGGLSLGQRQLLAFARALASNPDLLILDEATSFVDVETERLIQDSLRKLMKNRTSIIIAHRLSTIREADQILVLHKGRVAEIGTHFQLLQEGIIYKKFHEMLRDS